MGLPYFLSDFPMAIFLGHLHLIQSHFLSLFANRLIPHSSWFFSLFYKSLFIEQWVLCIHIRLMVYSLSWAACDFLGINNCLCAVIVLFGASPLTQKREDSQLWDKLSYR